jgi:hypothetical protein
MNFAVPESLTNECSGLCGDSDCIEEWKNNTSKATFKSKVNSSCVVGFIKTGDVGDDSLYTIHYQSMVSDPNHENHSHLMTDLRFGRSRSYSTLCFIPFSKVLLVSFKENFPKARPKSSFLFYEKLNLYVSLMVSASN